jgi:hypothetical protein
VNGPSQFRGDVTFQPIVVMAPDYSLGRFAWLVEAQEAAGIPSERLRTTVL